MLSCAGQIRTVAFLALPATLSVAGLTYRAFLMMPTTLKGFRHGLRTFVDRTATLQNLRELPKAGPQPTDVSAPS